MQAKPNQIYRCKLKFDLGTSPPPSLTTLSLLRLLCRGMVGPLARSGNPAGSDTTLPNSRRAPFRNVHKYRGDRRASDAACTGLARVRERAHRDEKARGRDLSFRRPRGRWLS